jgi:hypothetical protein
MPRASLNLIRSSVTPRSELFAIQPGVDLVAAPEGELDQAAAWRYALPAAPVRSRQRCPAEPPLSLPPVWRVPVAPDDAFLAVWLIGLVPRRLLEHPALIGGPRRRQRRRV